MPLFSCQKRTYTFRFGQPKRTIVYMQNSGEWNGIDFSSSILSCEGSADEISGLLTQASNYINEKYPSSPIHWQDVFQNKILSPEGTEGDMIGDKIRNRCFLMDDIHLHGGYIGGGKTGDKFIEIPKLRENHLPIESKDKSIIVTNVCAFTDRHRCQINQRKGSIDEIRQYQQVITKMMMERESRYWLDSPHAKKQPIIDEIQKILQGRSS